jgi:F0F1-type ATP synthase epsilon subunit
LLEAPTMNHQDHEDIWHVQLPTGEVRTFTIDQLDAAFQVEMIHEGCYVRREGAMTWRTLAEELADEAPQPQPQPVAQPAPVPAPVVSYQPIYSTAPMVSSLDADEVPASFRGGSKKKVVAILGGVAAIAAIAVFGVTRLGASAQDAAAAAGAAVNVTPSTPGANAPSDPAPAAEPKLTEAQRKALAEMDQANERKAEERRKTRLENAPRSSKPYKSEKPFSKGGNKYDPLNAKL